MILFNIIEINWLGFKKEPKTKIQKEVEKYLTEGKRVTAVKTYRDLTGAGLRESKEYVDKLAIKMVDKKLIPEEDWIVTMREHYNYNNQTK